jgi:intracellular septation protein A
VDASRDTKRTAATGRLHLVAKIVILDVAAPLAAYNLLRSAGLTTVTALLLSGAFPALGVAIGVIGHRRIDLVGALVLAGIVVGTVLGLISHSARLVLMEGSVATVVFGAGCLGSLWTRRPLMYGLALEFTGPDTAKGREMISLWQYEGFRRVFRVITTVWGVGFLLEAALRVVIVYNTSAGTALAISNVTPFIWAGILSAWTVAYGTHQRKKGERMAAADAGAEPGEITNAAESPTPGSQPR